jgi:glycosyltransferase involved in cell wall biosynthesis
MNILVFTSQIHKVGGYERLSIELAVELNRLGYRADLLSLYTNDIDGVLNAQEELTASGVQEIHYLGLSVKPSFISVLKSILRFRRLLLTKKYNAVEVSGFTQSLVVAIGTIGIGAKVIIGIHQCYYKNIHNCFRYFIWVNILRLCTHVKFYAITQAVARDWIDFSNIHSKRLNVVLNSVNDRFFDSTCLFDSRSLLRNEFRFADNQCLLLFVGRLVKSKGIDTLFDATKTLLNTNPNWHLMLVGREDNSESANDSLYLKSIKNEISTSSWGKRVHFLGERNNVPDIMADCDLLIHPPRFEGFGLILAEALAIGLPVVASNVGGIPEVLAGTDSLMVPADDALALKDAIESALAMPQAKVVEAISKGKSRAEAFRAEKRAMSIVALLQA